MPKRTKTGKRTGVFVPSRDGKDLERRFRALYKVLNETIKGQRKSADQLELAGNKVVEKFKIFWFGLLPPGK